MQEENAEPSYLEEFQRGLVIAIFFTFIMMVFDIFNMITLDPGISKWIYSSLLIALIALLATFLYKYLESRTKSI